MTSVSVSPEPGSSCDGHLWSPNRASYETVALLKRSYTLMPEDCGLNELNLEVRFLGFVLVSRQYLQFAVCSNRHDAISRLFQDDLQPSIRRLAKDRDDRKEFETSVFLGSGTAAICGVAGYQGAAAQSASAVKSQTALVVAATDAFLSSMDAAQREKVQFPFTPLKTATPAIFARGGGGRGPGRCDGHKMGPHAVPEVMDDKEVPTADVRAVAAVIGMGPGSGGFICGRAVRTGRLVELSGQRCAATRPGSR